MKYILFNFMNNMTNIKSLAEARKIIRQYNTNIVLNIKKEQNKKIYCDNIIYYNETVNKIKKQYYITYKECDARDFIINSKIKY